MKPDNSDNSEGEAEEGDYTVYECPGLAPVSQFKQTNSFFTIYDILIRYTYFFFKLDG